MSRENGRSTLKMDFYLITLVNVFSHVLEYGKTRFAIIQIKNSKIIFLRKDWKNDELKINILKYCLKDGMSKNKGWQKRVKGEIMFCRHHYVDKSRKMVMLEIRYLLGAKYKKSIILSKHGNIRLCLKFLAADPELNLLNFCIFPGISKHHPDSLKELVTRLYKIPKPCEKASTFS